MGTNVPWYVHVSITERKRNRNNILLNAQRPNSTYPSHDTRLSTTHRSIVPIEEGTQQRRRDGPVQITLRYLIVKAGIVRKLATRDRYRPLDGPSVDDGIATRGQLRGC